MQPVREIIQKFEGSGIRCVESSFERSPYERPSGPGAEFLFALERILLMSLGLIGLWQMERIHQCLVQL